jgi:hypothetical protein
VLCGDVNIPEVVSIADATQNIVMVVGYNGTA